MKRYFITSIVFILGIGTASAQDSAYFFTLGDVERFVEVERSRVSPSEAFLTNEQIAEISHSVLGYPFFDADNAKVIECLTLAKEIYERLAVESASEIPEPERSQITQILSLPAELSVFNNPATFVALEVNILLDVLAVKSSGSFEMRSEYILAKADLAVAYSEGMGAASRKIAETACHDPALQNLLSEYVEQRSDFEVFIEEVLPKATALSLQQSQQK